MALVGASVLALALVPLRSRLDLASDLLAFLVLVVAVALIGGLGPSLLAAVAAAGALNFWFTEPVHSLAIGHADDVVALVGFTAVAVMVSWVVDVAARRQQAAAAAAELAAGNRLRTALLAAVGHDLRTPLATAKAVVSGLRSGDVELTADDRVELLETADGALDRLTGLVDDLLDMSRLQSGAMATHLRPVPLDDVVARALDAVGVEPRAVVLEIAEELPPALADAGLLERVVANLVVNAQRFAPPGRPPVLTARTEGPLLVLKVVDHGPGIPPEARDRVFLPFQRLDDSSRSGIGLGLALSRGLVEAMGGTLEPEETPGGGLTMVVSLPAAQEEP
jgi:two-component system sensor histidine kinase KdpD